MGGGAGQRIVGQPVGVTVGLTAIPEHLDQIEDQRPRSFIRIRRIENLGELVEVDRARQQGRVVHRRHAKRRAGEVRGNRGQRAAHDPALAIAVVVEGAGIEHRAARGRAVLVEGLEGAFHPAGDLPAIRFVFDGEHLESRRAALRDPVGQIGIAKLREGVIAHRKLAGGVALIAGHGEVPGEVQVLAADAGLLQLLEDVTEVLAADVDLAAWKELALSRIVAPWLKPSAAL